MDQLKLEGTFQLAYNGADFASEDLGILLTFEKLVDTSAESSLTFKPLSPILEKKMYLVWKKHQVFSPIAERFLTKIQDSLVFLHLYLLLLYRLLIEPVYTPPQVY